VTVLAGGHPSRGRRHGEFVAHRRTCGDGGRGRLAAQRWSMGGGAGSGRGPTPLRAQRSIRRERGRSRGRRGRTPGDRRRALGLADAIAWGRRGTRSRSAGCEVRRRRTRSRRRRRRGRAIFGAGGCDLRATARASDLRAGGRDLRVAGCDLRGGGGAGRATFGAAGASLAEPSPGGRYAAAAVCCGGSPVSPSVHWANEGSIAIPGVYFDRCGIS